MFQIFDVSHTVSSTGWTTSLSGKMRTSYNQIFDLKSKDNVLGDLIINYQNKIKNDENERLAKIGSVVSDSLKGNKTEDLFKKSGGYLP